MHSIDYCSAPDAGELNLRPSLHVDLPVIVSRSVVGRWRVSGTPRVVASIAL